MIFTSEHQLLRDSVRQLIDTEINPTSTPGRKPNPSPPTR